MRKLIVSSSSFLVPNNKGWEKLLEDYFLEFCDYGDWSGALLDSKDENALLLVIFLEDLISEENSVSINFKDRMHPLLSLLNQRLRSSSTPVIFCMSSKYSQGIIRGAKINHILKKAFYWMLEQLEDLANIYRNFYFIDMNQQFGQIGFLNVFDNRNWYFAHCRLNSRGVKEIAYSASVILKRHFKAASKVLVLDCDNTIWGGVVGEDGLREIILGQDGLGQAFVDFQKEVKKLIDEGIIIVLASKNNENDVWEVFDKHNAMVLKKEDIVASKINWNEKSENIKLLAIELGLGLESFVLWDDNPIERDRARALIPEINTVEMPKEVFDWPEFLRNHVCFAKFYISADDVKKNIQYQSRAKFILESNNAIDEITYLKSIQLTPSVHNFEKSNIERAAQLCAKTNQFNFRTVRHTVEDLVFIDKKNKNFCFLISLKDIYGDHGIVGLVCLKKIDSQYAFIDTFLLSCRVLGRHLEAWMLSESLKRCHKHGIKYLIGEFISTQRNIVANNFFTNYGFDLIDKKSDIAKIITESGFTNNGELFKIITNPSNIPYREPYEVYNN